MNLKSNLQLIKTFFSPHHKKTHLQIDQYETNIDTVHLRRSAVPSWPEVVRRMQ